jgi:hypothetical protein
MRLLGGLELLDKVCGITRQGLWRNASARDFCRSGRGKKMLEVFTSSPNFVFTDSWVLMVNFRS